MWLLRWCTETEVQIVRVNLGINHIECMTTGTCDYQTWLSLLTWGGGCGEKNKVGGSIVQVETGPNPRHSLTRQLQSVFVSRKQCVFGE